MDSDLDVRESLEKILRLLESNGLSYFSLRSPADKTDDEMWEFLTSNALWGGPGSIADQALLQVPEARRDLDLMLIELGRKQLALGRVNVRTEMWTSFFEKLRT